MNIAKDKCPLCRNHTVNDDGACYCPSCIADEKRDLRHRDGAYMLKKSDEARKEKYAMHYFGYTAYSDPPRKDESTLPFLFSKNKRIAHNRMYVEKLARHFSM
ncbi:hypothetical protein AGDE_16300 [Angomonas deanei]|nr:hypothetical protein AGDE_16300 [Angomonas deanei]|eukprot:EPY17352.1 hypothetical protein AGDE_16300 [Angomonas deanei]